MRKRISVFAFVSIIMVLVIIGTSCQQNQIEPPFDSIIPKGIKTAPKISAEYSWLKGENIKGTYYDENNIMADYRRTSVGEDITCTMTVYVFIDTFQAERFFTKDEQYSQRNLESFDIYFLSDESWSSFSKQRPDDILVYQADTHIGYGEDKERAEFSIEFRVGRYIGEYWLRIR